MRTLITILAIIFTLLALVGFIGFLSPTLFINLLNQLPQDIQNAVFFDILLRGGTGWWVFAIISAILWYVRSIVHHRIPSGGSRRLSKNESRALKTKQKRASMIAKGLPSKFSGSILLPKNKVICPRCGAKYKIYALYGGGNTRYGCGRCGKVFT